MGKGLASKIDTPRDLPSGIPHVQWKVENDEEIERFLEPFQVYTKKAPGHNLLILGLGGMNLQLSPGDCLVLWPASKSYPHDRLGVVRVPESAEHRESEQAGLWLNS